MDTLLAHVERLGDLFFLYFGKVLVYPLNPVQRIYCLYLATSLAAAGIAWALYRRRGDADGQRGFLRFCFPREVWSHPSAWLDVRYFFFHQTLRVWMYAGLAVSIAGFTADWLQRESLVSALPAPAWGDRILLTVVSMALLDFVGFAAHWAQHRIPFLWEFHRVHHSSPVMQPLSNYREHPIDNLLYTVVTSLAIGVTTAGAGALLGCRFQVVDVLGINAFLFVFNLAGYNLRHSHIWLAWPGIAGQLIGSPAYHQIHHSVAPEHIDKNLAFLFPIWDRLFGTQVMPGEREALVYGLGDGTEGEYDSVLKLYYLPFLRLFRRPASGPETPDQVTLPLPDLGGAGRGVDRG